ncbi:MAG TPA: Sulphatase-modifying factor protein [Cyanobacteria bacterium UBA8803]|nr:Sulphatase-modifying factor protein [Cyanobacteria bacterium UBA8803]
MSQNQPPVEPPSEPVAQPRKDDAVLGGQAPVPITGVVLGGLPGVTRRLAGVTVEGRIAALSEALKYGEAGLELVLKALEDESWQVQYAAFCLLQKQKSLQVKQRLKKYLPWFEFEVVTVDEQSREISRDRHLAQYFTEDLGNGVTLEMVAIPGGTFRTGLRDKAGCGSKGLRHPREIVPFYMGKFSVTQAQWQAVAALPKLKRELKPNPSSFKGDNLPVERISWYDAVEFCQRISKKSGRKYRLPTEAQWEYACRAGTTTPFHFGETITTELANYNGQYTYGSGAQGLYREQTTPVGSFQVANAFGLYDMHGNVWEWCADSWHKNYQGAPSDGRAWYDNDNPVKLLRGGSWSYAPDCCRCAFRLYSSRADDIFSTVGLRVVARRGENFYPFALLR